MTQETFSTAYHVRAIIEIGYSIEEEGRFVPPEYPSDLAPKIQEDLEKTGFRNVRTAFLVNGEYKKMTVTAIADLPDTKESKRTFDTIVESHIKRLAKIEMKSKRKHAVKTSRLETPSTDVICTAGCRFSFSAIYAVAGALIALAGCALIDRLKGRKT
jgi:hypothetical protein